MLEMAERALTNMAQGRYFPEEAATNLTPTAPIRTQASLPKSAPMGAWLPTISTM